MAQGYRKVTLVVLLFVLWELPDRGLGQEGCDVAEIPSPCEPGTKYASRMNCNIYYKCTTDSILDERFCPEGKLFNVNLLKCKPENSTQCAPPCPEERALARTSRTNTEGDVDTNVLDTGPVANDTEPGPRPDEVPPPDGVNGNDTLIVVLPVADEVTPTVPTSDIVDESPQTNITDVNPDNTAIVAPGVGDGDVTNDTDVVPPETTVGEVPVETTPTPLITAPPEPSPESTTPGGDGLVPGGPESTSESPDEPVEPTDPPYVVVPPETTTVNGTYVAPSTAGLPQKTIFIIAGVIGGVVLILLIILIVCCVRKKKTGRKENIAIIENDKYMPRLENPIYRQGRNSPSTQPKYRFSQDADVSLKSKPSLPKRTRNDLPSSLRGRPKGFPPKGSAPAAPNPFTGEPTPPRSRPKRPPPPVFGDSWRDSLPRKRPELPMFVGKGLSQSPYGSPQLGPTPDRASWVLPGANLESALYSQNLRLAARKIVRSITSSATNLEKENNNVRSSPLYARAPFGDRATPSPNSSLRKKKAPPPPNPFGDFDDDDGGQPEAVPMTTFGRPAANNLTRPDDNVYHVDETNPIYQRPSPHAPLLKSTSGNSEDNLEEKPMTGTHERSRSTDYSSSEESSSEDDGDAAVPPSAFDERQNENQYDVPNGNPYAASGVSSFTNNRVYDKPQT